MSNQQYYARRAARLCPDCAVAVAGRIYCVDCADRRNQQIQADRDTDRAGYNLYMQVNLPTWRKYGRK